MRSEREKMLAGELYDPLDAELVQARIRASFGEISYQRLARLKARLDPDNRFALNQNIEPATHT